MRNVLTHHFDLQGDLLIEHNEMMVPNVVGGLHVALKTYDHMTCVEQLMMVLGQLILVIVIQLAEQLKSQPIQAIAGIVWFPVEEQLLAELVEIRGNRVVLITIQAGMKGPKLLKMLKDQLMASDGHLPLRSIRLVGCSSHTLNLSVRNSLFSFSTKLNA